MGADEVAAGLRTELFIGGGWRAAAQRRPVINPTTGERITDVAEAGPADVDLALDAARSAARDWRVLAPLERAAFLQHIASLVTDKSEQLAAIVTLEQGKTIGEARGEIAATAEFFRFFAEFARRIEGEILPSDARDEHVMVLRVPYGVSVGVLPWNYPSVICARKAAPAMIAGNTVILKPHEDTPLSALALADVCLEAGLPAGVLNVVTGAGETVGEALVKDPRADLITMTGSVEVGKQILSVASQRVAAVSLELGGKAPFIVMPDADLDEVVPAAVATRFMNCGQVCTCNERTFVHKDLFDGFLDRYLGEVGKLRVGDPFDESTDMGPKVSEAELRKVASMVDRARDQGAVIQTGGAVLTGDIYSRGYWYAPTVITNVQPGMEITEDEIFGPVSPVMAFDDLPGLLDRLNASRYGLSAYLFTEDLSLAMRTARDLEFGELYINRIGPEQLQGFHTGFRESGLGGDDGKHGLDGFLRKKTIYLNYARKPRHAGNGQARTSGGGP
jgi:lactaldehyde dehydrogenase/glycolaldehyde dehydrogenase